MLNITNCLELVRAIATPEYEHTTTITQDQHTPIRNQNIGICFDCGHYGIRHRHHLDKNRKNNKQSNIIEICPRCHCRRHRGGQMSSANLLPTPQKYALLHELATQETLFTSDIDTLEREYHNRKQELNNKDKQKREELYLKYGVNKEWAPLYQYPYPLCTLDLYKHLEETPLSPPHPLTPLKKEYNIYKI